MFLIKTRMMEIISRANWKSLVGFQVRISPKHASIAFRAWAIDVVGGEHLGEAMANFEPIDRRWDISIVPAHQT